MLLIKTQLVFMNSSDTVLQKEISLFKSLPCFGQFSFCIYKFKLAGTQPTVGLSLKNNERCKLSSAFRRWFVSIKTKNTKRVSVRGAEQIRLDELKIFYVLGTKNMFYREQRMSLVTKR